MGWSAVVSSGMMQQRCLYGSIRAMCMALGLTAQCLVLLPWLRAVAAGL